MNKSRSLSDTISSVLIYASMFLAMAVTLYPFLYVVSMSVSDKRYILDNSVWLYPKGWDLDAYQRIFDNPMVWTAYGNTLFYVFFGATISVTLTILGAYPLSRKEFTGRQAVMMMIVFTMFFSGGLIPKFLLINNLGLYDTRWSLILPGAVGTFGIIIARTFFKSVSEGLYEAARIDGANDLSILFRIVVPLSKPIVAVLGLFAAVSHWNGYFDALLYLPSKELHPLALYLANVVVWNQADMESGIAASLDQELLQTQLKYALIIFAVTPVLIFYPFVQKHFVKGALIGSFKE